METRFDEFVVGPPADGAVVDVTVVLVVTPPGDVVDGDVVDGDVADGDVGPLTCVGARPDGRDTTTPAATKTIAASASAARNGHRRGSRGDGEGVIESTVTVESRRDRVGRRERGPPAQAGCRPPDRRESDALAS
ncbi:MAG: hypothetical protein ACP5PB_01265 [Acidimicrobiales bacterium]